ncbi:hypothetical protein Fmac_028363 [Flemingia macrophylla]|uniref:Uncharacterized protein n=1 Tax=Flemingia macrophylla TaxID=520843 RepID=A0ABD1L7A2_9FABA
MKTANPNPFPRPVRNSLWNSSRTIPCDSLSNVFPNSTWRLEKMPLKLLRIYRGRRFNLKLIASDYLETNLDLMDVLISGYVLDSPHMKKFFYYIQLPNFDIAADAATTFKELLTRHKSTVAEFLSKNYEWTIFTISTVWNLHKILFQEGNGSA